MFAMTFKYFSGVLQLFETYVASVSDVCCKRFSCFRRMLQVFHLSVAKVDLVLDMLQWDPPTAATCCSYWVTSGWCEPTVGAPSSGRKQACEKPSAGVRAHTVGHAKNRRHELHFSCAHDTGLTLTLQIGRPGASKSVLLSIFD
jgi:hypothetical protein